jgi:hypothetical protein
VDSNTCRFFGSTGKRSPTQAVWSTKRPPRTTLRAPRSQDKIQYT